MPREDHRHPDLPADVRAESLLAQMTLEEKCAQLTSVMPWSLVRTDGSDAETAEQTLRHPPGHVAQLIADNPAQLAHLTGSLQRQFVTRTRLGIPALFHVEALNGPLAGGHMVFPTAIGLAATWSPGLVREMAALTRRQMIRTGMRLALGPVMDVALDPRWGRVHETYGEDPYLAAAFSVAHTRGLQGTDLGSGMIATGKHFLGYAVTAGGVNQSAFEAGARWTRDVFAYPFEAAIQLAGLRSVMNSYGTVDGIPAGISREVLTGLLRETLGFDGFVSSDYGTIEQVVTRQRAARSPGEAGRLAIQAGLDVEFPTIYAYGSVLAEQVELGNADIGDVDTSLRRVLRAKFELGLFENPYPQEHIDISAVAAEGRELSLELARRSVVLVKNDGILPLARGDLTVAVTGPHGQTARYHFPTYTYPGWRDAVNAIHLGGEGTMVGAENAQNSWLQELLPPADAETLARDRYGTIPLAEEIGGFADRVLSMQGSELTRPGEGDALEQAVEAARASDIAVLALGGASLWFHGERTEGEASDTADISLPAAQTALAEAVAATGTPLVAVLIQGRPFALPQVIQDAAAIIIASYGGPFGPRAVAEVLYGAINPGGKLPYSIPRHAGQIPVYHHQRSGTGFRNPLPPAVRHHYLDMPATPLYPFGHGLSYTSFALGGLDADAETDTSGSVRINATVTNTGGTPGATVVQLYVRVNTSGVTRPAQQLAGFCRVSLDPDESRRVAFTLEASQLGYTNAAREFAVEPANVEFFVGLDSDDRRLAGSFEVTGKPRPLTSSERSFLSEAKSTHA